VNVQKDNFQENVETIQSELVTGEHEVKIAEKIGVEEFTINGDALGAKIKELVHQGNIRRIIIKNEEGHILMEIPLTVGVVGGVISAAFFPIMAAVGSITSGRLRQRSDGCSFDDRGRKTRIIFLVCVVGAIHELPLLRKRGKMGERIDLDFMQTLFR
jgi:hypothetical protein